MSRGTTEEHLHAARLRHAFALTLTQCREQYKGRKKVGLTQEELGRLLGMDRSYVTALESGSHNPTLATMWKLMPVLGVSFPTFARRVAQNYEKLKATPDNNGNG